MIKNKIFWLIVLAYITVGCGSSDNAEADQRISKKAGINIIPAPAQSDIKPGNFTITRQTVIAVDENNDELLWIGEYLGKLINSATWYSIPVNSLGANTDNSIILTLDPDTSAYENNEAYRLTSDENGVIIMAPTAKGIFYGVQTLRQLLPPEIEHTDPTLVPQNVKWTVPAVEIQDHPRFSYRGMHLDVARHFFPVDFVKRYIDLLAMHKMNRFHWHLTDDQGWRIEIKKYPALTEVGAWRDSTLVGPHDSEIYDGKRYGGYYTQEEIREVVKYAQNRQITIIPEIELPGHSSAILAAYPQFGCKDGNFRVRSSWGIFDDILCPTEETFSFIEDIMTEVMDLFPSEYIHIGGDEARKVQWERSKKAQEIIQREGLKDEHELQSYFITRVEKFLNENGRQIIGWDEILEGGLAPNATVMSWRGIEGGITAAKQGHDVIMTPNSHAYMDRYQADPETEPLTWGGFVTLEKTYSFEPIPEGFSEEEEEHVLGAQGNVWTEYIHSGDKVEYMAYPRASALAELNWTPKSKKDFQTFWIRLQSLFERFDIMGVSAAQHYRGEIPAFNQE